jgi:hypothetical protein
MTAGSLEGETHWKCTTVLTSLTSPGAGALGAIARFSPYHQTAHQPMRYNGFGRFEPHASGM